MEAIQWIELGWKIGSKLGEVILTAIARGDTSVLDQKVSDLLGPELRTTIARMLAEREAAKKFAEEQK